MSTTVVRVLESLLMYILASEFCPRIAHLLWFIFHTDIPKEVILDTVDRLNEIRHTPKTEKEIKTTGG